MGIEPTPQSVFALHVHNVIIPYAPPTKLSCTDALWNAGLPEIHRDWRRRPRCPLRCRERDYIRRVHHETASKEAVE